MTAVKKDISPHKIYLELFLIFFKIGSITFGGGYVMLPYIYRELVIRRKWFTNSEIVDIFTVSQSIPGAIAVNAAFNTGFRRSGVLGGIVATCGVVLPAFLAITLILYVFINLRDNVWAQKFLAGVITASAALILLTAIDLAKSVFSKSFIIRVTISLIVFVTVGIFDLNAMWMIFAGMIFGVLYHIFIKRDVNQLEKSEGDRSEK